jgi:hypothetical protein
MQATGLEDAHGEGIFEGDIVAMPGLPHGPWEVVYEPGEFVLYNADRTRMRSLELHSQERKVLVVGNIYRSPDLLAKHGRPKATP